jgi:hypothetical protein
MSLPEIKIESLPDARVRIIGLTPDPIECSFENLKALIVFCTKDLDDNTEPSEWEGPSTW